MSFIEYPDNKLPCGSAGFRRRWNRRREYFDAYASATISPRAMVLRTALSSDPTAGEWPKKYFSIGPPIRRIFVSDEGDRRPESFPMDVPPSEEFPFSTDAFGNDFMPRDHIVASFRRRRNTRRRCTHATTMMDERRDFFPGRAVFCDDENDSIAMDDVVDVRGKSLSRISACRSGSDLPRDRDARRTACRCTLAKCAGLSGLPHPEYPA
jgi:hypothetical protein